jgi:hypothetical protein
MTKRGGPNRSDWAVLTRFDIPNMDTDDLYLTRWRIVQTPWAALYLHRITTPDSHPTLHDHPWSFLAIVLRGGYVERRLNPRTMEVDEHHRVRWVNRMRTHDFHAITSLSRNPTWTLLFVGARRRTWGYLEPRWSGHWEQKQPGDHPYWLWTDRPYWRWTQFDKHSHAREFDAAMDRRSGVSPESEPV